MNQASTTPRQFGTPPRTPSIPPQSGTSRSQSISSQQNSPARTASPARDPYALPEGTILFYQARSGFSGKQVTTQKTRWGNHNRPGKMAYWDGQVITFRGLYERDATNLSEKHLGKIIIEDNKEHRKHSPDRWVLDTVQRRVYRRQVGPPPMARRGLRTRVRDRLFGSRSGSPQDGTRQPLLSDLGILRRPSQS